MHQNHPRVFFILNLLKLSDFMFSTKILCQFFFQTCLKGFKLKRLVVEPKMAQPVELDEKPVNPQLNQLRSAKKPSLSSKMVIQPIKVELQLVDPHLNRLRSNGHLLSIKC